MGYAFDAIGAGLADVVVTGGSDVLARLTYGGFNSLRSVDPEPCRPFDRERKGLSIGEAAGILVFEEEGRARRRGAPVVAEFRGYGVTSDAFHMTAPDPSGAAGGRTRARRARRRAAWTPSEVDYVNAHGTATPQNDSAETAALKSALGERATRDPDLLDQVHDRALPLRLGRHRGGRDGADRARRQGPAHDPLREPGSRPATSTTSPTRPATPRSAWRCRTPSPSAATARSSCWPSTAAGAGKPACRWPRTASRDRDRRRLRPGPERGRSSTAASRPARPRSGPFRAGRARRPPGDARGALRRLHAAARDPRDEGAALRPRQPVRADRLRAGRRGGGLPHRRRAGADRHRDGHRLRGRRGADRVPAGAPDRVAGGGAAVPLPEHGRQRAGVAGLDRAQDLRPQRHGHAEGSLGR